MGHRTQYLTQGNSEFGFNSRRVYFFTKSTLKSTKSAGQCPQAGQAQRSHRSPAASREPTPPSRGRSRTGPEDLGIGAGVGAGVAATPPHSPRPAPLTCRPHGPTPASPRTSTRLRPTRFQLAKNAFVSLLTEGAANRKRREPRLEERQRTAGKAGVGIEVAGKPGAPPTLTCSDRSTDGMAMHGSAPGSRQLHLNP